MDPLGRRRISDYQRRHFEAGRSTDPGGSLGEDVASDQKPARAQTKLRRLKSGDIRKLNPFEFPPQMIPEILGQMWETKKDRWAENSRSRFSFLSWPAGENHLQSQVKQCPA